MNECVREVRERRNSVYEEKVSDRWKKWRGFEGETLRVCKRDRVKIGMRIKFVCVSV
jgi:hypothetical protein